MIEFEGSIPASDTVQEREERLKIISLEWNVRRERNRGKSLLRNENYVFFTYLEKCSLDVVGWDICRESYKEERWLLSSPL